VLDALVDREDAHVAGAAEATVGEQRLEVAQRLRVAVGAAVHAVDEVRTRQVQQRRVDRAALVLEQVLGLVPQQVGRTSPR
jgi:hypothetical protein